MGEVATTIDLIQSAGVIGMFVIFIGGFRARWWIWGEHHNDVVSAKDEQVLDMREDRDYWRDAGTRGTYLAEQSVDRLAGHSLMQQLIDEAEAEAQAQGRTVTVRDIQRVANRRQV